MTKNEELCRMLHLESEPVGVFFGNTDAVCDFDVPSDDRYCVVPFIMDAAKGKSISLTEDSCTCAGGATGCCFGDGFARLNPNIHKLLSQGFGEDAPADMPPIMKEGERYFVDEELGIKWRDSLPYSDRAYPRIVFAPQSKWGGIGTPDLVFISADPDRISALITLAGSHNGRLINTIVPFGSACQAIMYAAEQMDQEEPMGVLGGFDLSQRPQLPADHFSLTMPYVMWETMAEDLEKSCLTTEAWREIEKRL